MYYQQDEGEPAMNLHDKRVKIIAAVLAILLIIIGVRIFMNVMSAKEKAEKALNSKYEQLALQFSSYGALINQMESSFSGLKMMISQSTSGN